MLGNVFVAVHSYKLTHFANTTEPLTDSVVTVSLLTKVKLLFTGIDIPRPQGCIYPKQHYTDISITVDADKHLSGWHILTDSLKKGTVVVFHGFMDNKSSMLAMSDVFLELGYDVLLIDFMGSGNSYGNQTTMGYLEAENVYMTYKYVVDSLHEENIYLCGFSMGAVATMKALADHHMIISGAVLQAPYASLERTIAARARLLDVPQQPIASLFTFWIGAVNGFNGFDAVPIRSATNINAPTLLMCGEQDPYIPKEETLAIYSAIASSKKDLMLFEHSKHESYLVAHPNEWKKSIKDFMDREIEYQ